MGIHTGMECNFKRPKFSYYYLDVEILCIEAFRYAELESEVKFWIGYTLL